MGNARKHKRNNRGTADTGSTATSEIGLRTGNRDNNNGDGRQILFYSNAPWAATGYGQQTAQICQRLKQEGNNVAIHANYGLEGSSTVWNGFTVYPKGNSVYSDDVIVAHYLHWAHREPERKRLLMTLYDVWVFKSKALETVEQIVSWVPIDHTPCPPDVLAWCNRPNVVPVAMSLYGQKMLHQAGVDALYAPHGIEPVFKPTPGGRKILEISEDRFVVMMTAANKGASPPRKAFAENILAFGVFCKKHPEALLYLHTEKHGVHGINLVDLLKACGVPEANYQFVDQYAYQMGISQEVLASFYTMADVLLAVSMGEGFGIPVVEAQACGTRVITSDQTAQPELVGDGWLCRTQPFWDHAQRAFFHTPITESILECLELAWAAPRTTSQDALNHAKQYQADEVFNTHWKPIMGLLS